MDSRTAARTRRWVPLGGAVLLVTVVAASAAFGSLQIGRAPLRNEGPAGRPSGSASPPPDASDAASLPPPDDTSQFQLPGWLTTTAEVLCGLAVVALVGLLLWYVVRDTIQVRARPLAEAGGDPDALTAQAREVVAAVDAGLADLSDADADTRRAVIACWVRLEEAAAAAGTWRLPGETPADLVGRLLTEHRVSRPVLDGFAAVYREARYATHVVDEQMRATAVTALRQLRAELAVPAGAGG
jgi:hypothetical protein